MNWVVLIYADVNLKCQLPYHLFVIMIDLMSLKM